MGMEKPYGREAVIQKFGAAHQSAKALFQSPGKAVVVQPVLRLHPGQHSGEGFRQYVCMRIQGLVD